MRARAAVIHVHAAPLVLGFSNRWVWGCAVRSLELTPGDAGDFGPENFSSVNIEPLVQVHADTHARFIDPEELSQPSTEERNHLPIRIGEEDFAIGLRPLSCVECGTSSQEGLL